MSIDQALQSMGIECCAPPYRGDAAEFITYQLVICMPLYIAGGAVKKTKRQWGADLYTKADWQNDIGIIVGLLEQNGFTVDDYGPEIYEAETGYYHIPISFYEVI